MFDKKRRPTPWLAGLLAIGLIGSAATGAIVIRNRNATPDIAALTESVQSQPLTVRITASGDVKPIQTVNLSPKSAGILAELYVQQGDRVSQGQIIARMENADIVAEIEQARARVAQAQARLSQVRSGNRPEEISRGQAAVAQAEARVREAQSRLALAEDRVERNRSLADAGAISQDTLNQVISEAETARATVTQLQAGVRESRESLQLLQSGSRAEEIQEAQAQLQEAIANLRTVEVRQSDTVIRAPFGGIITQRYASEGAFVSPATSASAEQSGTSTAIVALAQGLEVVAEVPEVDIQQLRPNQPVEIVADAFPDDVFRGRVRLIAPEAVVRQNVTSFEVRVSLETGQDKLLSGMNVDLTFLGEEVDNAITVPIGAIVTAQGQTGVLVPDENNEATFRPVTLGTAVGDQTQILEGLQPGDRIFTAPPPGWSIEDIDPAKVEE
ncbi:efflux RND transporter periplasmic adaptor subunit [Microcoleus sp. FACHB-1515]|uniref:efflux RND transporter periplasmic adaptor subunit n=1 Tax=Cyanophyceae TaxID=3028117 RepID=UPI001F559412|nr:efflux RND transporter periplasmic adaptor subunit [Microcoleus sp. FACHB-1515]